MNFSAEYRRILAEARSFVGDLDDIDNENRLPVDDRLRTCIVALATAINTNNWRTAAEALVMLQQVEVKTRPEKLYKGGRKFLDERDM